MESTRTQPIKKQTLQNLKVTFFFTLAAVPFAYIYCMLRYMPWNIDFAGLPRSLFASLIWCGFCVIIAILNLIRGRAVRRYFLQGLIYGLIGIVPMSIMIAGPTSGTRGWIYSSLWMLFASFRFLRSLRNTLGIESLRLIYVQIGVWVYGIIACLPIFYTLCMEQIGTPWLGIDLCLAIFFGISAARCSSNIFFREY